MAKKMRPERGMASRDEKTVGIFRSFALNLARASPKDEGGGYSLFPLPARGPNSNREWYLLLHEVKQLMSNPQILLLRLRALNTP